MARGFADRYNKAWDALIAAIGEVKPDAPD